MWILEVWIMAGVLCSYITYIFHIASSQLEKLCKSWANLIFYVFLILDKLKFGSKSHNYFEDSTRLIGWLEFYDYEELWCYIDAELKLFLDN